jgi:hypothetical protein
MKKKNNQTRNKVNRSLYLAFEPPPTNTTHRPSMLSSNQKVQKVLEGLQAVAGD